MGNKGKLTKKFLAKGGLDRTLAKRRAAQKIKKGKERVTGGNDKKGNNKAHKQSNNEDDQDEEEDEQDMEDDQSDSGAAPSTKKSTSIYDDDETNVVSSKKKKAEVKKPAIEDLDVDDFLESSLLDKDDDEEEDDDDEELEDDEEADEGEAEEEEVEEDGEEKTGDEDDEEALRREIEEHEQALKDLAKNDPEFFKHLQKEDQELLRFSASNLDGDEELEEDEEDTQAHKAEKELEQEGGQKVLTSKTLNLLKKQIVSGEVNNVITGLKKLARVFRVACHVGDDNDDVDGLDDKQDKMGKGKKDKQALAQKRAQALHNKKKHVNRANDVKITSSQVFNDLLRFSLRNAPKVFLALLRDNNSKNKSSKSKDADDEDQANSNRQPIDKSSRWGVLSPVIRSFIVNLLHLLSQTVEERMTRFILNSLEAWVALFEPQPFHRYANKLLKVLLDFWSKSERNIRIDAFLRIRQLCIELPPKAQMLELALKGIYLTYVRNVKFTTQQTVPVIEFMSNCVVELYSIDLTLAYQHAFVYIRQMAIHLRQALLNKSKDAHKQVYHWQFIHSLQCWSKLLSAHANTNNSILRPLIYPFVQVAVGTINVLPSSRYFPLRFQILQCLIQLGEKTKVFIPLAPYLLTVINSAEFQRLPVGTSRKAIDVHYTLKASKSVLRNKAYQEQVLEEFLSLSLKYFHSLSYSIAFPELVFLTIKSLRTFAKETQMSRFKKSIQTLIQKLEHNADWVAQLRNSSNYSPKDMQTKALDAIESFNSNQHGVSPLARYVSLAPDASVSKKISDDQADWTGKQSQNASHDDDDDDDDGHGEEEDDEEDQIEEDDDDEEEEPTPKKPASKADKKRGVSDADLDKGQADKLEALDLSDLEDEDDEGNSQKKKKQKKQPPQQPTKNNKPSFQKPQANKKSHGAGAGVSAQKNKKKN